MIRTLLSSTKTIMCLAKQFEEMVSTADGWYCQDKQSIMVAGWGPDYKVKGGYHLNFYLNAVNCEYFKEETHVIPL